MRFVYLSEGRAFLKTDGSTPVEIESPFAREKTASLVERSQRNAWKNKERDSGAGAFPNSSVWGKQAADDTGDHPTLRHVAKGSGEDELIYALAMSASSGLFRFQVPTGEEKRLFHRHDFDPHGISCDAVSGEIIVSSLGHDGLGKLEQLDGETHRRRQITEGDSHDCNPSHDPSARGVIYFQSSGAGRDETGRLVAFGPAAIHRLELTSGELKTILEDAAHDFIQPRMDGAGNLHFIRRPYGAVQQMSFGQKVKAFFLVPYHLLAAIYGFLDAFSRMFGKKSLRPTGGPAVPVSRGRFATFHGVTLQLEQVLKKRDKGDDSVQLVPATWELVRRSKSGAETVLARHVAAYDLKPDGTVIYSDGLRLWLAGATPRKLHHGKIFQSVIWA